MKLASSALKTQLQNSFEDVSEMDYFSIYTAVFI